ncbi:MAG TPA: serine hydrolase [Candidatus Limnocylindria bacterium]|nr:serine hydrolase [Candidatus Limnocylindria bacterium]
MIRTAIIAVIGALLITGPARAQVNIEQIVAQKVQPILPQNGKGGGVAVAVRMNGKTSFFNYGFANNAQNRRVAEDSIFNLGSVGKVFATTLLAQAVKQDELSLDDPVAKYVTELQRGGDIRRVTLGQLASHTSGLPRVPQQYEQWHRGGYKWPDFARFLNSWKAGPNHEPGQQYLYSNAAMVLLRVALEGRFNTRFAALMHQRLTGPLGMTSTALPLPRDLLGRAVQGYSPTGQPSGRPGEEGGTFEWPGSGQIYSSSRDMATFLAANLGELPDHRPIESAMALAQQPVFTVGPRLKLGLAWQNVPAGNFTIIDKNGGLNNTSTYIGFAPQRKLGVVILVNRGKQHATGIGRQILHALAQDQSEPSSEGEPNPDSD